MLPAALGAPRPLPPDLLAARAAIDAALRELLAIPDGALRDKAEDGPSTVPQRRLAGFEQPWPWLGRDRADVRYGFYHLCEVLEKGRAAATMAGRRPTQAGVVLGDTTAALWDLHGLLLPLGELLDRDPGGGEWSIRQTLAHVIAAQRDGAIQTAYSVHRFRNDPALPLPTPEEFDRPVREEEFVEGDLAAARRRMDEWHDVGVGWLAAVDDDAAMAAGTMWNGFEADVRFRLHRWPSHLREHTIQVEKTLAVLGHQPTEVARIVRVIAQAYGRLEAEAVARPGADGPPVAVLADAVERAGRQVREIVAAAG
jgi:hypothetical protein